MSYQYDLYLQKHRNNVYKAYAWLADNLPEVIENVDAGWQIEFNHDTSKNEKDEYEAYDAYFYGGNRSYAVVLEFRLAWLLHIHRNPHHWQHWVLINDDPEKCEIVLEMPYNYIVEMICDWWAFSFAKGNLTEIFDWYDKHSKYIKLEENTRKTVEDMLGKIRDRLESDNSDNAILRHHGIKGQKWGVKNGPPYPLDKQNKNSKIVKEAIESGEVSKTINREKQIRHTKSGHLPGRSYLDGDLEYAQELVDKYGGKGTVVMDKHGNWTNKEKFEDTRSIGIHVDVDGTETKTNKGMITYSKTGTHVYPRKEK